MNVAAHQDKEKNEKTGKGKAGEERRQATDFKEAACCLLLSFRGQHNKWRTNSLCEGSAQGNWDPREGQQLFRFNPNGVEDRTTTLRWLLIGAVQVCSLDTVYSIYNRNFALRYSQRSESIRVLGTDRRSVLMIRAKVNSKSELVENREGKSTLYGVICCCDDTLLSRAVMWSYGLDLRSIKSTVVKVVVSSERTCNNCLFVEVFNYFLNCSDEIFDFLASNS